MTPSPARPIADGLRESPGPAALLARYETARAIGRVLQPIARSVAPGIDLLAPGSCDLRDGVLWIAVRSAAESAKLRQAAPRMLATLTANGWQVYEMKTRVQAGITSYPGQGTAPPSSPEMGYSEATEQSIGAIESMMRKLPESPLKRAIERLAATLRRVRT
ncbi:MAG TPA: hypothetical protein VMK32_00795 [Burkholderiaceae bacterium]|nr:hypothetical protein [Burkholderiaceae bacterium]